MDITFCPGGDCTFKYSCKRYSYSINEKNHSPMQNWFTETPFYKVGDLGGASCESFLSINESK